MRVSPAHSQCQRYAEEVQHHCYQYAKDPADRADEDGDQVDGDVGPADEVHQAEEVDKPEQDNAHDGVDDEPGDAFDRPVEDERDDDHQDQGKECDEQAHTTCSAPGALNFPRGTVHIYPRASKTGWRQTPFPSLTHRIPGIPS